MAKQTVLKGLVVYIESFVNTEVNNTTMLTRVKGTRNGYTTNGIDFSVKVNSQWHKATMQGTGYLVIEVDAEDKSYFSEENIIERALKVQREQWEKEDAEKELARLQALESEKFAQEEKAHKTYVALLAQSIIEKSEKTKKENEKIEAMETACVKGANHHKVPYVVAKTISSGYICLMLNTAIDMQHKCDIIETVFPSGSFDEYVENMTCYMLDLQKDQKETEKFQLALRLLETNEEEETITKEAISAFKSFCNESHTVERLAAQYAKLFSPRISVGYAGQVAYERLCSFSEMIPFIKSMEVLGELETELSRQLIAQYGYNPEKDWLVWSTEKEVKDCLEQSIQLSIINVFDNFMSVRAGKASYKYSMVEVENDDCEVTTVWGPDSLNAVGSHI